MAENNTFETILNTMLARVPTSIDKREGSFIYDALAPTAVELQNMYIQSDYVLNETFAYTASREAQAFLKKSLPKNFIKNFAHAKFFC